MPKSSRVVDRPTSLRRLEQKPQENLSTIHAILRETIASIGEKLQLLESSYCGPERSAVDEIRRMTSATHVVMTAFLVPNMTSSIQIDELIKMAADPDQSYKVEATEMEEFKESYRKIRLFLADKFSEILARAREVVKYLEKYCVSFYALNNSEGVTLDTVTHFYRQTRQYADVIQHCLDTPGRLYEKFTVSKLFMSDFGSYGVELVRKGDCSNAVFIVAVAECCESIRSALATMSLWIADDANYATFLKNDVKELERKKVDLQTSERKCQQRHQQLVFRRKHLEMDREKRRSELQGIAEQMDGHAAEEELLQTEIHDLEMALDRNKTHREDLNKKATQLSLQILSDSLNKIAREQREMKLRLPVLKRQLQSIDNKVQWYKAKKRQLKTVEQNLKEVAKSLEEADREKLETEIVFEGVLKEYDLAKKIYFYKTCSDVVEKIFHGAPIEANNARLRVGDSSNDPFERACAVIASSVGSDWTHLYRALPFHPPRGTTTIDSDLKEITSIGSRLGHEVLIMKAIHRWRRYHTRSKLGDLLAALAAIKRQDVIQKIDELLHPVVIDHMKDEADLSRIVPPHLIPHLKQVLRFDQLKAEGKFDDVDLYELLRAKGIVGELSPSLLLKELDDD